MCVCVCGRGGGGGGGDVPYRCLWHCMLSGSNSRHQHGQLQVSGSSLALFWCESDRDRHFKLTVYPLGNGEVKKMLNF